MSVLSTYLEYAEHGEPGKVVTKREQRLDAPGPNEVLVKILAAPINPADINVIQGTCVRLAPQLKQCFHELN